jgi:hypothetical protein
MATSGHAPNTGVADPPPELRNASGAIAAATGGSNGPFRGDFMTPRFRGSQAAST